MNQTAPRIDASETTESERTTNQALYLIMALIFVLNNLPYLWGMMIHHEGLVFSGFVFNFTFFDALSYLAKMRAGLDGDWLYTNYYTTEDQQPALLFTFYIVLGHLARLTGLSLIVVFHLARMTLSVILLLAVKRLLESFGLPSRARILAFAYIFLAAGFGWLVRLRNPALMPLDYEYTEGFAFNSMANFPHFVMSNILLIGVVGEFHRFAQAGISKGLLTRLAVYSFAQAWVHPRIILTVGCIGMACALLGAARRQWKLLPWFWPLAVTAAAAVVPMILTYRSVQADPLWSQWASTPTLSPTPYHYLLAYGLLFPLAIYGSVHAIRSKTAWGTLIVAWFVVACLLPYIPDHAQRRMIQGWNIPMAILSGYGLMEGLLPALAKLRRGPHIGTAVVACISTVLCLTPLWYSAHGAKEIVTHAFPAVISQSRKDSLDWLRENTEREDVVMTSERSGMYIPAFAGNRVVMGHWAETLNRGEKFDDVKEFYSEYTFAKRRAAIADKYGVRYVLLGQWEQNRGQRKPRLAPEDFERVWGTDTLEIYRRVR